MNISLIIPAYNEEKYITTCLRSIAEHGQGFFEVIVVNNASTDNTGSIVQSFISQIPALHPVYEPHKGLPYARICGLNKATGEIVVFIDADCKIVSGWYDRIFTEFQNKKDLMSLSGPYRYYDLAPVSNILAQVGWWLSAPLAHAVVGYTILLGNVAIRKQALDSIGGFNTEIPFYGDDTDLARRLSALGNVDFRMNFFVYTSSRRLQKEGLFKTFWIYGVNFVWEVIFKKPYTHEYKNIR